jgi:hypothetical protein
MDIYVYTKNLNPTIMPSSIKNRETNVSKEKSSITAAQNPFLRLGLVPAIMGGATAKK